MSDPAHTSQADRATRTTTDPASGGQVSRPHRSWTRSASKRAKEPLLRAAMVSSGWSSRSPRRASESCPAPVRPRAASRSLGVGALSRSRSRRLIARTRSSDSEARDWAARLRVRSASRLARASSSSAEDAAAEARAASRSRAARAPSDFASADWARRSSTSVGGLLGGGVGDRGALAGGVGRPCRRGVAATPSRSGATPLWSIRLAKSRSSSDTLGGYPVASGSWANCSTSGEGREPTRIGGRLSSLDRSVPLHALGALPGRVARARPRDRARRRVLAPVGGQYNLKATASDVGDRGVQPLACQTNEDR